MAYLAGFGHYLPPRVVTNDEIGARVDSDPAWILNVSGIAERRFAVAIERAFARPVGEPRKLPGASRRSIPSLRGEGRREKTPSR